MLIDPTRRKLTAMCGRFTLRTPLAVPAKQFLFDLDEAPAKVKHRFNIAPTLFSLYLCSEHRKHNWFKVREQLKKIAAPSISNFI